MSKWSYTDEIRTGYVYPRNLPHHGPDGTYGAKVWRTGTPEPGPNEGSQDHFATLDEALVWVASWKPAP